jgi:hypothetical protein
MQGCIVDESSRFDIICPLDGIVHVPFYSSVLQPSLPAPVSNQSDAMRHEATDSALLESVSRKQKKAEKMEIIFHFSSKSQENGTNNGFCTSF